MMFIGAITNPGIDLTLDKGIGRLYLGMTSLLISFLSNSGLAVAPLCLAGNVAVLDVVRSWF
jgi:hypothetical protein